MHSKVMGGGFKRGGPLREKEVWKTLNPFLYIFISFNEIIAYVVEGLEQAFKDHRMGV